MSRQRLHQNSRNLSRRRKSVHKSRRRKSVHKSRRRKSVHKSRRRKSVQSSPKRLSNTVTGKAAKHNSGKRRSIAKSRLLSRGRARGNDRGKRNKRVSVKPSRDSFKATAVKKNDRPDPYEIRNGYIERREQALKQNPEKRQHLWGQIPPCLKHILGPIKKNMLGYNCTLFSNTRFGRVKTEIVERAAKTARIWMEKAISERSSEQEIISIGQQQASIQGVLLSPSDLQGILNGPRDYVPTDAVVTATLPDELLGIRGESAPLMSQRDLMLTADANHWGTTYLDSDEVLDPILKEQFRGFPREDQALILGTIHPDMLYTNEKYNNDFRYANPHYVSEHTFANPAHKVRYDELVEMYNSGAESSPGSNPSEHGSGIGIIQQFYKIKSLMQDLHLYTIFWHSQVKDGFDPGRAAFLDIWLSLTKDFKVDCQEILSCYLESPMMGVKDVKLNYGNRFLQSTARVAPVESQHGNSTQYMQLDQHGHAAIGLGGSRLPLFERGNFVLPDEEKIEHSLIDPSEVGGNERGTKNIDMVYSRYEPPTPDMLNKAKYLPFMEAMINEGRRGGLSEHEAQEYVNTCHLSIDLYNTLGGVVTGPGFPTYEEPITKLRISIMHMGEGALGVVKYRLWMLYIIMGQVIRIQYMIGELELQLAAYLQTTFVTNVLLGKYKVASTPDRFAALGGLIKSQGELRR